MSGNSNEEGGRSKGELGNSNCEMKRGEAVAAPLRWRTGVAGRRGLHRADMGRSIAAPVYGGWTTDSLALGLALRSFAVLRMAQDNKRFCADSGGGSGFGRWWGVGGWRELGDADDDFSGFGALQLLASDSLDRVRIGFQGFDLIAELDIFGVESVDVFADFSDFDLSVAHRDKAMRAENIVNDEREDEQTEHCAAMLLQKVADLIFYRLGHVARTHFVASSVSFADAFELSAST